MSMIPGGGSNLISQIASQALMLKGLQSLVGDQTTPQKEGTTPQNGAVNFSGCQPGNPTCGNITPRSQGQSPEMTGAKSEGAEGSKPNGLLQQLLSLLGLQSLLSKLFPSEQKSPEAQNGSDQAGNTPESASPASGNPLLQFLQSILDQLKESIGLGSKESGKTEGATPALSASQTPDGAVTTPGNEHAAASENASAAGGKEGGLLQSLLTLIGLQSLLQSLSGGNSGDQGQKQA